MISTEAFDLAPYLEEIDRSSPVQVKGRVKSVVGLLVRAVLPQAWVGELWTAPGSCAWMTGPTCDNSGFLSLGSTPSFRKNGLSASATSAGF